MSDIFRTLIVPAAEVDTARAIAAVTPGGEGMWTAGLSASGAAPATHYISTGWIPEGWQAMVPSQTWEQDANGDWVQVGSTPGDPMLVLAMSQAAGLPYTLADILDVFAVADVTDQDPFVALGRTGLQIVQDPTL